MKFLVDVQLPVRLAGFVEAAGHYAELAKARWATMRTKIIRVPGRIASTSRRLVLHLLMHWTWARGWESLHAVATGPPLTAAT